MNPTIGGWSDLFPGQRPTSDISGHAQFYQLADNTYDIRVRMVNYVSKNQVPKLSSVTLIADDIGGGMEMGYITNTGDFYNSSMQNGRNEGLEPFGKTFTKIVYGNMRSGKYVIANIPPLTIPDYNLKPGEKTSLLYKDSGIYTRTNDYRDISDSLIQKFTKK